MPHTGSKLDAVGYSAHCRGQEDIKISAMHKIAPALVPALVIDERSSSWYNKDNEDVRKRGGNDGILARKSDEGRTAVL